MLLTTRPSRDDRRLWRHGLGGWARIESAHTLRRTDHYTELTEFDLELVVPGSESYRGTIVFDVTPADKPRLAVGETISIRVDPATAIGSFSFWGSNSRTLPRSSAV